MKIGFFTDCYTPTGFGVETSIETFRKGLEKMGHEVYIFAPFSRGYKDTNPRVFRFHSLKVIKKPEIRLAFPLLAVNSFREIKEIMNLKFDIVHAHTPVTLGFLGKYVALQQKIPFIYTHHTQYPDYVKFYFKERVLLPYFTQALTVWFSNISDAVIVPSYKIKKILRESRVKKSIYILPTGANTDIFKKSLERKRRMKEKLNIPQETKILLFVGRIGKEKNIEFLLNMFKKLLEKSKTPVNLLIIGDGPYLEELRQLSRNLQIDSFIKFTGFIPHNEVAEYYQTADIFVFSSLTETQGIVILEAMACGLPIVALKDDVFKEMVFNNKNGFLINPKGDNKKEQKIFAQKVSILLNNRFLYKKFSNVSYRIAQCFSEKKQAKKLLDIYRNLIKIKTRVPRINSAMAELIRGNKKN